MNSFTYSIETSKENGYNTVVIYEKDGVKKYLHSAIAPSKEKHSIEKLITTSAKDVVIILGCGLGYHLQPLLALSQIRKIIIIDILENIQTHASKETIIISLSKLFPIYWITGHDFSKIKKSITECINLEESTSIFICEHPASLRLFPDFYTECRKIINDCIRNQAGNIATKRSFGKLYQKNIIKNLELFTTAYPVKTLKNIFKNKTAVIVSSAPSADLFMDQLKTVSENIIIFCVDSAYSVLKSYNIRPDFIISIDPQPWTEEHLLDIDSDIPVIASLSSWKKTTAHKVLFLSLSTHPLCQVIEHFYPNIIGSIDSGTGSVAGDAINTALYTGCSRIYLIGLDFSFPDHIIYAKNSTYNRRFTGFLNSRVSANESLHINYIRRSGKKTSVNGIMTRESFLQFKSLIEKIISESSASFFHCKGKGLSIEGAKYAQLIDSDTTITDKVQLINKLSTLSTISSLINLNLLFYRLMDKKLFSQILLSSYGSINKKDLHYMMKFINQIKSGMEK